MLTSGVEVKAVKARSEPLLIRTSTFQSAYCIALSGSWKRARKVSDTLKDNKSYVNMRTAQETPILQLELATEMPLSEHMQYMIVGLLGVMVFSVC
jgi:hypothetical protein